MLNKATVGFDESLEHTLGDFIRLSMTMTVFPKGIPRGMSPEDAVKKLERKDVKLPGLGINNQYFCGWFEKDRLVRSTDGREFFRFKPIKCGVGIAFELTLLPAAIKLLKG